MPLKGWFNRTVLHGQGYEPEMENPSEDQVSARHGLRPWNEASDVVWTVPALPAGQKRKGGTQATQCSNFPQGGSTEDKGGADAPTDHSEGRHSSGEALGAAAGGFGHFRMVHEAALR